MVHKNRVTYDAPPLARYFRLSEYRPEIGDFIIKSGWFTTRYGVVAGVVGHKMLVVWEGLPILLFTSTDAQQSAATREIDVDAVVTASPGSISIMRHDAKHNAVVWYV